MLTKKRKCDFMKKLVTQLLSSLLLCGFLWFYGAHIANDVIYFVGLIGFVICLFYYVTKIYTLYNHFDYAGNPVKTYHYQTKRFLSPSELDFYHKLDLFQSTYRVIPQVNLACVVDKIDGKYQSELYRNIDYGLFDANFNLLLLIELNDSSHNTKKRQIRDAKVRKICDECHIPLLTFYTSYPNNVDYVCDRIQKCLDKEKEIQN